MACSLMICWSSDYGNKLWSSLCVSTRGLCLSSSVSGVFIIILCYMLMAVRDFHGFCGGNTFIQTDYGVFSCCWSVVLVVTPWEVHSLALSKCPTTLQSLCFSVSFVLLGECLGGRFWWVILLWTIAYATISKMCEEVTGPCMVVMFMYLSLKITLVHLDKEDQEPRPFTTSGSINSYIHIFKILLYIYN